MYVGLIQPYTINFGTLKNQEISCLLSLLHGLRLIYYSNHILVVVASLMFGMVKTKIYGVVTQCHHPELNMTSVLRS